MDKGADCRMKRGDAWKINDNHYACYLRQGNFGRLLILDFVFLRTVDGRIDSFRASLSTVWRDDMVKWEEMEREDIVQEVTERVRHAFYWNNGPYDMLPDAQSQWFLKTDDEGLVRAFSGLHHRYCQVFTTNESTPNRYQDARVELRDFKEYEIADLHAIKYSQGVNLVEAFLKVLFAWDEWR